MALLFPAKGVGRAGRGDDCSSGEEERAAAAVMMVGGLGESPGPASDSESRSSSPLNLTEQFERAVQRVPTLMAVAGKDQLLYLYARYKQVRLPRRGPKARTAWDGSRKGPLGRGASGKPANGGRASPLPPLFLGPFEGC